MEKYQYKLETNQSDLNLYECGVQTCAPGHSNGPAARRYYLLHFVTKGAGIFQTGGITHRLSAGNAFLICPGQVCYYSADAQTPWVYAWLAMDGIQVENYLKQAGLSRKSPVYTADDAAPVWDALLTMVDYTRTPGYSELRLMGYLYLFLSELAAHSTARPARTASVQEAYLQKLVRYVDVHLWERITVSDLADFVGLDRSYLYKLCKERLKVSPQEFVIRQKLSHARNMLAETDLPVGDIARSVGYDDQLGFSKLFKKRFGISPRAYRENDNTP